MQRVRDVVLKWARKVELRGVALLSIGLVVVLVVCAILGKIPLTLGVVGHEGSTVIVVLNSLRLLWRNDRS